MLRSFARLFVIFIPCSLGFALFSASVGFMYLHLYDTLANAIDSKEYTIGVLIDLSKAFDTFNHEVLVAKLQHYGIPETPLK